MANKKELKYKFTWDKFFSHWKVVRKHRKYVRQHCFRAGLYRQGLLHDLSKYHPAEFFESVRYFTGDHSPIDECKKDKGYSAAWMHHKSHNKHHREYWTDNYDSGTTCVKMPWKYALECFCDYLGAGQAYNNGIEDWRKEIKWYTSNRTKMKIHPDTLFLLDSFFVIYLMDSSDFLKNRDLLTELKWSYNCKDGAQYELADAVYHHFYPSFHLETLDELWTMIGRPFNERYPWAVERDV